MGRPLPSLRYDLSASPSSSSALHQRSSSSSFEEYTELKDGMSSSTPQVNGRAAMANGNSAAQGLTPAAARSQAAQLNEELSNLRELLSVHESTLTQANVTLTSPLIDKDGFPLADVDLLAVRTARQQIRMLRNDIVQIQERLHALLQVALMRDESEGVQARPLRPPPGAAAPSAATRAPQPSTASAPSSAAAAATPSTPSTSQHLQPFAKINSVSPHPSPAAQAGLQAGDLILRVSTSEPSNTDPQAGYFVDASNHDSLRALPPLVQIGREVIFEVRRGDEEQGSSSEQALRLGLIPQSGWGGRGLLG